MVIISILYSLCFSLQTQLCISSPLWCFWIFVATLLHIFKSYTWEKSFLFTNFSQQDMPPKSIHAGANYTILFFLRDAYHSTVYIYTTTSRSSHLKMAVWVVHVSQLLYSLYCLAWILLNQWFCLGDTQAPWPWRLEAQLDIYQCHEYLRFGFKAKINCFITSNMALGSFSSILFPFMFPQVCCAPCFPLWQCFLPGP